MSAEIAYRGADYVTIPNEPVSQDRAVGFPVSFTQLQPEELPCHQPPNLPTINALERIIFRGENPKFTHITQLIQDYPPPRWEDIPFFPSEEMFAVQTQYDSLHGAEHSVETILYGYVVSYYKKYTFRQTQMVAAALGAHDLRKRTDNNPQIGHGAEAAVWFAYDNQAKHIREQFNEAEQILIQNLLTYHDIAWKEIPDDILSNTEFSDLLETVKIADALARWRAPREEWHPNPDKIRTKDRAILADLLQFSAYVTLSIRKNRLEKGISITEGLKVTGREVGLLRDESPNENILVTLT